MMQPVSDPGVDPARALELQGILDRANAAAPPDLTVPFVLSKMRHGCTHARLSGPTQRPVSAPLDLKEVYVEHEDGVHALIYREGKCNRCGMTARSPQGRVVLMTERPPLYNRVSRT